MGFLFDRWNVPAAWILAAILCAGGCALLTRRELVVRSEATTFAKALIAMVAAVPLTTTPPQQLVHFIFPGLMVAAVTLAMSCAGGLILARTRRGDISPETGILSLLAGGASIMPVLAQELGADYRYVALSQYLRYSRCRSPCRCSHRFWACTHKAPPHNPTLAHSRGQAGS